MKNFIIIFIVFFVFFLSLDINAEIEEQSKSVEVNGQTISAKVIASISGTDIVINDNLHSNNITQSISGENLFPQIFEGKNKYYISWIQYEKDNIKLYLYDSYLKSYRILIDDNFKFIGNAKPVYWKGQLRALLFLGFKNEQDDIYIYDVFDGAYKNVTNTSGFEKKFSVNSVNGFIYLKTETNSYLYDYQINLANLNCKLISSSQKEKIISDKSKIQSGYNSYNTMVAFGDSITWGKIRMDELISVSGEMYWLNVDSGLIRSW